MVRPNVRISMSASMNEVGAVGEITVIIENDEPNSLYDVVIIVESPSDILDVSPKNKHISSIKPKHTSETHFSAKPKTKDVGFAVTVRYTIKGNSYIHTSDHIVQI